MKAIAQVPLYERIGQLIGVDSIHTAVDIQRLVEERLRPAAFNTFIQVTGFPKTLLHRLVIPKRTLSHRLQADESLTAVESDRLVRIAHIAALAERVFGDEEKAHHWLTKPKGFLADRCPMETLETEAGARVVEEQLYRIDYGLGA
jgi:putative toxin-antitoxin system antitoxin component (TIGR02293 family)